MKLYDTPKCVLFQLYNKYKDDPPIPRNNPPVSGRITWVRQLAKRILDPMEIFMVHLSVSCILCVYVLVNRA